MRSFKAIVATLTAVLLMFSVFSMSTLAAGTTAQTSNQHKEVKAVILAKTARDQVKLLEEDSKDSKVLTFIPDNTEVIVLKEGKNNTYVSYTDQETNKSFSGYIENRYLFDPSKAKQILEKRDVQQPSGNEDSNGIKQGGDKNSNSLDGNHGEKGNSDQNVTGESKDHGDITQEDPGNQSKENGQGTEKRPTDNSKNPSNKNEDQSVKSGNNSNQKEEKQTKPHVRTFAKKAKATGPALHGVALKKKTAVYADTDTKSKVLKSYSQGSILKFKNFNSDWYQATVYINGKAETGYINKKDVEVPTSSPKTIYGVGVKSPTKVYSKASTGSKVLKSYAQGATLKYKTFISNWYKATVIIKGKAETGYINKSDVEIPTSSPKTLHGVGVKDPTKVYSKASTGSKVLKSYAQGSILKYKTFISNWYEATVIIKGKKETGYIQKSDVEAPTSSPTTLHGVAVKNPTKVYTGATTQSKVLKSYAEGSILKYKTFVSGWYEAKVYIKGEPRTGYISSGSVQNIDSSPKSLRGVLSQTAPTEVYAKPTVHSEVLKTYPKGATLKYKTFTADWYQCTVYIKGNPVTGYIKVYREALEGRVIVLDPGHGGVDPGAHALDGTWEQKINYDYGVAAKKALEAKGAKVIMTHNRNQNCKPKAVGHTELQCRVDVAKKNHADIYISIHGNWSNSSNVHGVETYYNATGNKEYPDVNDHPRESKTLAEEIHKKIVPALGGKSNGIIDNHFYVNRMNTVPSVLIELGYLSNRSELNRLEKTSTQSRFANALASAIVQYFKDI